MSRYIPYKKANVYIFKNNNRVFYGMRTIYSKYSKNSTGKIYVRYNNRYYRTYHGGRNILPIIYIDNIRKEC